MNATHWQPAPPPPGVWAWREGDPIPVQTLTIEEHDDYENPANERLYWRHDDGAYPWGTARWAPIPKPEES